MPAFTSANPPAWQHVSTVTGPVAPGEIGITDAHAHVWISPAADTPAGAPVLDEFERSLQELVLYRQAGGGGLLDCQPYGSGRDGRILARLAVGSGVRIVGSTGFHLRKYYPPGHALWMLTPAQACDLFAGELLHGMRETLAQPEGEPVQAGFIKTACEATLERSPLALLEGAAQAARQTGAVVAVHTEQGAQAEQIVAFFNRQGLSAHRLVLCHMDKRADAGLHRELAREGVLLEYDTFFRPKYEPERNLWPLLDSMMRMGLAGSVALATDLADPAMWKSTGGGSGLAGLPSIVQMRLRGMGYDSNTIQALLGENILQRLARVG